MEKKKKNNNNNSSNSLVFGRRQKCFKVHPLRRFAVVGPEVTLADPGRVVIWRSWVRTLPGARLFFFFLSFPTFLHKSSVLNQIPGGGASLTLCCESKKKLDAQLCCLFRDRINKLRLGKKILAHPRLTPFIIGSFTLQDKSKLNETIRLARVTMAHFNVQFQEHQACQLLFNQ